MQRYILAARHSRSPMILTWPFDAPPRILSLPKQLTKIYPHIASSSRRLLGRSGGSLFDNKRSDSATEKKAQQATSTRFYEEISYKLTKPLSPNKDKFVKTMERGRLLPDPYPQPRNDAIQEMTEGASLLLASPREALLPYHDKIAAINNTIRSLLFDINRSGSQRGSVGSQGHCGESVGVLTSWYADGAQEPLSRRPGLIKDVLTSAISHFESYRAELSVLQHQTFDWFTQDPRVMHLYPIMILQNKRQARSIKLRDRLLLVCSCMSLADDFHAFEKSRGWSSKQEILIADFLNDCTPAVQKIGKHLRSFLATFGPHMIDERRLDAGIRLGTKLNVAEAIGRRYGFDSCLTLVLGFEISRLSRLPFRALTALKSVIPSSEGSENILLPAKDFGHWWSDFRRSYALKFSNSGVACTDRLLGSVTEKEHESNVSQSSEASLDMVVPPVSFETQTAYPSEIWEWETWAAAGITPHTSDNLDMLLASTGSID